MPTKVWKVLFSELFCDILVRIITDAINTGITKKDIKSVNSDMKKTYQPDLLCLNILRILKVPKNVTVVPEAGIKHSKVKT